VPIMLILVGLITYQNISYYMGEYRVNTYFQDANGEYAMEAGLMAKTLGNEYQIYSLGAPRIFTGFPTFAFLAPNNPKMDLTAESIPTFDLPPNQKAVFLPVRRTARQSRISEQNSRVGFMESYSAGPSQKRFFLSIIF